MATFLGWAALLGSLVPFIVVPVFLALIHYRFVLREEPFMAERFGEAYDAYRTRVRRWLQRRRSMMPRDPGDNYALATRAYWRTQRGSVLQLKRKRHY